MYVCKSCIECSITETDGTITVSYSPGTSKTFAGFLRKFEPVSPKDVCMRRYDRMAIIDARADFVVRNMRRKVLGIVQQPLRRTDLKVINIGYMYVCIYVCLAILYVCMYVCMCKGILSNTRIIYRTASGATEQTGVTRYDPCWHTYIHILSLYSIVLLSQASRSGGVARLLHGCRWILLRIWSICASLRGQRLVYVCMYECMYVSGIANLNVCMW